MFHRTYRFVLWIRHKSCLYCSKLCSLENVFRFLFNYNLCRNLTTNAKFKAHIGHFPHECVYVRFFFTVFLLIASRKWEIKRMNRVELPFGKLLSVDMNEAKLTALLVLLAISNMKNDSSKVVQRSWLANEILTANKVKFIHAHIDGLQVL